MDSHRECRLGRHGGGEADDRERRHHECEENERTAKHESSFREGFGMRGERQVF
jgi:hypothetical protein